MLRESVKWVTHDACDEIMRITMGASLMECKKLSRFLKKWKFEMSPHDPCVWNAVCVAKPLTTIIHVDDSIMTHCKPQAETDHFKLLFQGHGQKDPLTAAREKAHENLGITAYFRSLGNAIFSKHGDMIKKMQNNSLVLA